MVSMSLFDQAESANLRRAKPLAARMRPTRLDDFVGQEHFLGEGKLLRRLLDANRLGSIILYGPPGTGKTTLARLLANETEHLFQQLSDGDFRLSQMDRDQWRKGPALSVGPSAR